MVRPSTTCRWICFITAPLLLMGCPKPPPESFTEDVVEANEGVVTDVPEGEAIFCEDDSSCPSRPNSTPVCIANECGFACVAGFADCDREIPNGCEQSLTTPFACGGCYSTCQPVHAFGSCVTGSCEIAACDLGYGDCDGEVENGCETPLVTPSNCGGCGVSCEWPQSLSDCVSGQCAISVCEEGYGDCDDDLENGCENTLDSLEHCGICTLSCVFDHAASVCEEGGCLLTECDAGYGDCDGDRSNGCEVELGTLEQCGACGDVCALTHATSQCVDGNCEVASCQLDYGDCDALADTGCEASLQTPLSCGSCENICLSGQGCVGAECIPSLGWGLGFGGKESERVSGVSVDETGHIYVAGTFEGAFGISATTLTSQGSRDIFLISFTSSGTFRWAIRAGGPGDEQVHDMDSGANGACLAGSFDDVFNVGATSFTNAGGQDGFVLCVDAEGELSWATAFGAADDDQGLAVVVDAQENVIVTGSHTGLVSFGGAFVANHGSTADLFLAAYDGTGAHLWSWGFPCDIYGAGRDLVSDESGNIYLIGDFQGSLQLGEQSLESGEQARVFMANFGSTGQIQWAQDVAEIAPTTRDRAIAVDSEGRPYGVGSFMDGISATLPSPGGENDAGGVFIVALSSLGETRWTRTFSASSAFKVQVQDEGHLIVSGSSSLASDYGGGALASSGPFFASYDAEGSHLWSYAPALMSGSQPTFAVGANGSLIAAGLYTDTETLGESVLDNQGMTDVFLLELIE
jgi:hypothetical protein